MPHWMNRDRPVTLPHPTIPGCRRREFLAVLAAAALSPGRAAAAPRPALQLYTVREPLRRDLDGTLSKLATIGYREVELAWLDGRAPEAYRAALDRAGLKAIGGHVELADITGHLPRTIATARTLGYREVVLPWIPEDWRTPAGYARLAELLGSAGRRLRDEGLRLGYHNHAFEFDRLQADASAADGTGPDRGYDLLLARTDPALVTFELDVYWARKGGAEPLDLFARHPGRFRLIHIKDGDASGAMVDIGRGTTDWATLLPAARRAGVAHFIAESDEAPDPLAFARASFDYLSGLTW